jgi:NAD(P)-dependent dehydrogenase (short-subunit alcohol dehydrogenase family)
VREAEERFGRIDGVFHAAGVVGEGTLTPIRAVDRSACELQFAPKVRGALVLEEVLRGRAIDFCVLQSSLSAVLGGIGFTAYAAANLFMDALAIRNGYRDGPPWIAVDWDGWRFDARSSARPHGAARSAADAEAAGITPPEGIEAIERILSAPHLRRVIVSTSDLQGRIDRWVSLEPGDGVPSPHDAVARNGADPRSETERLVAAAWRDVLGYEAIGIHDNFFELGGTSLHAIQLISRLQEFSRISLSADAVFEAPTIAELAARIGSPAGDCGTEAPAGCARKKARGGGKNKSAGGGGRRRR